MFNTSPSLTHSTAGGARKIRVSGPGGRGFSRRLATLAAAATIATSLSVALPLQSHAAIQADGHGAALAATAQSHAAGGSSAVLFVVTKGQKG